MGPSAGGVEVMTLLVVLTVLEALLLVGALALYLVAIIRRLRTISSILGKVAFGVRAVESQTRPIGTSVEAVNGALERTLSEPPPA